MCRKIWYRYVPCSLLARVCTSTNSEVNLAKKTLIHVPICYGSPKKSKTKSFYKGHFYSIKIRWNSVVFWKMTENSLHRTDFFCLFSKNPCRMISIFSFLDPPNMCEHEFWQVLPGSLQNWPVDLNYLHFSKTRLEIKGIA